MMIVTACCGAGIDCYCAACCGASVMVIFDAAMLW
jgi:hypothetical protein